MLSFSRIYRKIAYLCILCILTLTGLTTVSTVSANTGRVSLTPDPTYVTEGTSQTVSIHLDEPIVVPDGGNPNLTIDLVSSDPSLVSLSSSTVTYWINEWMQVKSFDVIAAAPDGIVTGNQDVTISFLVSSDSEYYDAFAGQITVTYVDADLQDNFAGGAGSSGNPYQISTCQQLQNINNDATLASANYILVNDIDCSDTINWHDGQGFVPLASFAHRFTGRFDGDGHAIQSLEINRAPQPTLGLFTYVQGGNFIDLEISGSVYNSSTELSTCMGGLAGFVFDEITIDGVTSSMDIDSATEDNTGGGLVGCISSDTGHSSISNSQVNAVIGTGAAGGLIGDANLSDSASVTVSSASTSGSAEGNDRAAGLISYVSYVWDETAAGTPLVIEDSSSTMTVLANGNAGGLIANLVLDGRPDSITDSNFSGTVTSTGSGNAGGLIASVAASANPATLTISESFVSTGITTDSGKAGGFIAETNSDLELTIEQSFAAGITTTEANYVGGLVGHAQGPTSISDSYVDMVLDGNVRIGGLIGSAGNATIERSFAFGDILSTASILGGLVGELSESTITDSFSSMTIASLWPTTVGGLMGTNYNVTVSNSYVDMWLGNKSCDSTSGIGSASSIDCTETNEPNYFFNNAVNAPIDNWNYDTIWQTNQDFFPCLQWQDYCQSFEPQVQCEMPDATATTITGVCNLLVRGGYNYGVNTWEARYKKASDDDYQTVVLADETEAVATIVGLLPETNYYLEFKFTNDWGIGEWYRVEFVTASNPEINIDMASSEDDSAINFIAIGCESLGEWQTIRESSLASQDVAFSYPKGLVAFNLLGCTNGGQATIRLSFSSDADPAAVTIRKYNQVLDTFTTLTAENSGLSIERSTLGGNPAIVAEYTITDGGPLDQDGEVNGAILDPVGLGVSALSSPNTGVRL